MVGYKGTIEHRVARTKRVVELYKKGLKQHQIAERMSMSKQQVSRVIKKAKEIGALQ